MPVIFALSLRAKRRKKINETNKNAPAIPHSGNEQNTGITLTLLYHISIYQ